MATLHLLSPRLLARVGRADLRPNERCDCHRAKIYPPYPTMMENRAYVDTHCNISIAYIQAHGTRMEIKGRKWSAEVVA